MWRQLPVRVMSGTPEETQSGARQKDTLQPARRSEAQPGTTATNMLATEILGRPGRIG